MKSKKLSLSNVPSLRYPIITLTTDYGLQDYFSGSVKGVLLQMVPGATIIDITHEIPPFDILSAAFVIKEAYSTFPPGTIHLVVIDPGVGTSRREIIVSHKDHLFVAPDNGVLTYITQTRQCQVYEILNKPPLILKASPTFAGRDHFAKIAGYLAKGYSPDHLGRKIDNDVRFSGLVPIKARSHLSGKIVYIDRFGNAITNITRTELNGISGKMTVNVKRYRWSGLKESYTKGDRAIGNLIINSSGHLEIFIPNESAQKQFKLKLLDNVSLKWGGNT